MSFRRTSAFFKTYDLNWSFWLTYSLPMPGFYLVHGPVLWTIGDRIYAASGRVREGHVGIVPDWINIFALPNWGPFGLEINYLLPHLILLPLTLCLAEAVTMLIDEPSNQFARWLFGLEVNRPLPKPRPGAWAPVEKES